MHGRRRRPPRARQRGVDRRAGLDRRRAALAAADRVRAPRGPRPGRARARADVRRRHRRLRDAPGNPRRRLARGRVDRPRRARGRAHLRRRARRDRAQQDGGRAGRQRGALPHARAQPAERGRRHVRPRPALHVRGGRRSTRSSEDLVGRTLAEVWPQHAAMLTPRYRAALGGHDAGVRDSAGPGDFWVQLAPLRDGDGAIEGGMLLVAGHHAPSAAPSARPSRPTSASRPRSRRRRSAWAWSRPTAATCA